MEDFRDYRRSTTVQRKNPLLNSIQMVDACSSTLLYFYTVPRFRLIVNRVWNQHEHIDRHQALWQHYKVFERHTVKSPLCHLVSLNNYPCQMLWRKDRIVVLFFFALVINDLTVFQIPMKRFRVESFSEALPVPFPLSAIPGVFPRLLWGSRKIHPLF